MRQVSRGRRATPKRATRKTAKRTTKSPARKRTTSKARGRGPSLARTWARAADGWRRFVTRHSYLKSYAILAAITVGIYATWASGIVGRTGDFIAHRTNVAMVSAGFTVQRVTFAGHMETSPGEVMDAMAVEIGMPIFAVDLAEARTRIESLDWVERAAVVRALPETLHVSIEEREPYAVWQTQGSLYVIAMDGTVIPNADVSAHSHLPHVVGEGAAREAHLLYAAMDTVPQIGPRVRSAVRVSDRRWDLLFDSGVVVQLPEAGIESALEALAQYENDYRLLARSINEVDMRLDDRIIVRPRNGGDGPVFSLPSAETET